MIAVPVLSATPLKEAAVQVSDPVTFTVVAQHHLGNRQCDQLTVAERGLSAATGTRWHYMIVDEHGECG